MQLSKRGVKGDLEKQILNTLYQVIADTKSPGEAEKILGDALTEVELMTVAKRLAIAKYLRSGKSYEEIHDQLKVSSATIAAIQTKMGSGKGFEEALTKIEADQWANRWAEKIMRWLGMKSELDINGGK